MIKALVHVLAWRVKESAATFCDVLERMLDRSVQR
jgi:hypothetical protein